MKINYVLDDDDKIRNNDLYGIVATICVKSRGMQGEGDINGKRKALIRLLPCPHT